MNRLFKAILPLILSAAPAAANEIELVFINHLQAEVVEQFVYVERETGSGLVYRVSPLDAGRYMDAPAYATADSVVISPLDHGEVGPYPRGPALGFTLGEWLAATGTAIYRCDDDVGTVQAQFDDLVPNGLYTMWYYFVPRANLDPFRFVDLPLGALDGSDSRFTADADGQATYRAVFSPCLQLSGRQLGAFLGIAWHSDGKTYGSLPGPMSTHTHLQLFVNFPMENR